MLLTDKHTNRQLNSNFEQLDINHYTTNNSAELNCYLPNGILKVVPKLRYEKKQQPQTNSKGDLSIKLSTAVQGPVNIFFKTDSRDREIERDKGHTATYYG